jgi:hypothetical protein
MNDKATFLEEDLDLAPDLELDSGRKKDDLASKARKEWDAILKGDLEGFSPSELEPMSTDLASVFRYKRQDEGGKFQLSALLLRDYVSPYVCVPRTSAVCTGKANICVYLFERLETRGNFCFMFAGVIFSDTIQGYTQTQWEPLTQLQNLHRMQDPCDCD